MADYYHSSALPPMPEPVYPREIFRRSTGFWYWVVRAVVLGVQSVTPLSFLYLVWYFFDYPTGTHHPRFLRAAAVWACVEVWFFFYYQYLAHKIQIPGPGSTMKHDELSDLFLRVMHAGLVVKAPLHRTRAYSAPGAWPQVRESVASVLEAIAEKASGTATPENGESPNGSGFGHGNGQGNVNGHGLGEVRGAPPHPGLNFAAPSHGSTTATEGQSPVEPRRRRTRLDSVSAADRPEDLLNDDDPLFDSNGRPRVMDKDDPRAIEFREQLRTWFNHVPWEEIHREDVREWTAWTAFALPYEDVAKEPKKLRFLNRTIDMLEARTGTTFPPGRSKVPILRLTIDPIRTRQRPFFIYAITNSINWFLRKVFLPQRGAYVYREGDIEYVVRIPPGWTPEKGRTEPNAMPVVYMHGLGYGLLQNYLLVHHLVESLPTHPLLFPLAHHTAQEVFNDRYLRPWTRTELVSTLKAACKRWGFWTPEEGGGVSMLSHSNGSVHHGWVVKDCPEMLRRNTFVDPVVFCLWEGDVCFNFCYRVAHTALELLLEYFVATEVGIANYIHRHFIWSDNTLFVEDIPNAFDPSKTAIFLGGEDIIIDAPRTRRYLERHGMRGGLHWDARAGHGDGLMGDARDRVVMYVGTGSTKGWQKWLTRGRRSHSVGSKDRPNLTPSSSSDSDKSWRRKLERETGVPQAAEPRDV